MEPFQKTIKGIEFHFHGFLEGKDEVCVIRADEQQFKMTTDENGEWQILQQVPTWIKALEQDFAEAIDEAYS